MDATALFYGLDNLPHEQQILFSRFGRGASLTVPHATIHEAFESIVDAHPRSIAAKFEEKRITYAELDVAANRLANHLIESGLQPRQRICLVVQRSIEMLVGIFAILKAGCQYVPIDGGISSGQTLRHILTDTGSKYILCLPRFLDTVRQHADEHTAIVVLGQDVEAFCSRDRPRLPISSADGAYAIYTSGNDSSLVLLEMNSPIPGSTGNPKGVDVSHRNVTNALLLEPGKLAIAAGSNVAQVLNIAFDMGMSVPNSQTHR
jgi:non-ribosomal peptide synthetase component F